MMLMKRSFFALVATAALMGCSDAVGPDGLEIFSLQLAIVEPESVSADETAALGSAFDRVDEYAITITDAVTLELIATDVVTIEPGGAQHVLDVTVPQNAFGRTVTISLIASALGVELYRSVSTTSLGEGLASVQVSLLIRYTGPGIRGRITTQNSQGVDGMSVGLYQGQSMVDAVATESDGTYLFLDVPTGQYQVQPTPSGGSSFVCPGLRDLTVQTQGDALVANFGTSTTACGTSVLVLSGGDVDDTDFVAAMLANDPTLTVSTFFHLNQLPGAAVLNQHDVVLLMMNGLFDESVALGNQVANYVTAGGNVVVGSFYWQGRSDSGKASAGWGAFESIDPFNSTGGARYTLGAINANNIVAHPLTLGVTTLTSTGYWGGVTVRTGTTVVAEWADGTPLIGYRILPGGQRIVGVSLFPASDAAAGGDVQALWENAVSWAGIAGGPAPAPGN
ncbi:MAG: hypothetical protein O2958_02310 [Gemmatimonadetes bacterium]|nr:hypothetical protein [Gemmatimonadota bacterium]MDA1102059.1 hypothetical protein [Gemmatimonadota bacterium]